MFTRGLATIVVVGAGIGCAYRAPAAHLPASLPAISVHQGDVGVEVVSRGQPHIESHMEERLRPWAFDILSRATRARAEYGQPARVTVRVDTQDEFFWMKACPVVCLFPAVLGVDAGYVDVAVDVTIDSGGRRYVGHGRARKWGSLYAPPDKRALAVAIDRALMQASAPVSYHSRTR